MPELSAAAFGLSPDDRKARMRRVAEIVLAEWSAEARQRLRSSLPSYLKSLAIREVTDTRAVVSLPGPGVGAGVSQLARIVEFGMGPGGIGTEGPYDVRKYLLRASTRNIRWGKNGPYLNVPFGVSSKAILAAGGRSALKRARELSATRSDHRAGRTAWGSRLPAGLAPLAKPHHASDPLSGLVRRSSTYSKAGGSQTSGYTTWRRASLNASSEKAWISKGVKARHLADIVNTRLPELLKEAL